MNEAIKQSLNTSFFKKFQTLLFDWWGSDFIILDKDLGPLSKKQKSKLSNNSVKSLFSHALFEGQFYESIREAYEAQTSPSEIFIPWRQTGFDLLILPLFQKETLKAYIVLVGFISSEKEKAKIKQSLSYIGLPEEQIESYLKDLKELKKSQTNHIKNLISILSNELFEIANQRQKQKQLIDQYKQGLPEEEDFIGQSEPIQAIRNLLSKIKNYHLPILIQGEGGIGKKKLAQLIHSHSDSHDKELSIQNCSNLNASFFETYLAKKENKKNKLGTLVFNHLENLSLEAQKSLSHFLNSLKENKEKIRIIATSNKNIEILLEEGKFQKDLYYQINVINIQIPALRNRQEDIPLLINHFLKKGSPLSNKQMSQKVMKFFYKYNWPNNIQELKQEVERMLSLSSGNEDVLTDILLSQKIRRGDESFFESSSFTLGEQTLKEFLRDIERQIIQNTLQKENGNKTKVAKLLGLSRTSIILKMKEYALMDYDKAGNF